MKLSGLALGVALVHVGMKHLFVVASPKDEITFDIYLRKIISLLFLYFIILFQNHPQRYEKLD